MISSTDLKNLENYLDKIWQQLGVDVTFTRHFLERVNDARNGTQITLQELAKLFVETYKRYGPMFAKMKHNDVEGVLSSISTKVNSPFVLKWNGFRKELELVAKTVMRKKNFVPNNPRERKYTVEANMSTPLNKRFGISDNLYKDIGKILEQSHNDYREQAKADAERAVALREQAIIKKPLNEEVEQIDEISKEKLNNYLDKSSHDINKQALLYKQNRGKTYNSKSDANKHLDNIVKRSKFRDVAIKKLAKEETLDEVSRQTLSNYERKAKKSWADSRLDLDDRKEYNREKGMRLAKEKLKLGGRAKVGVNEEELNEISKKHAKWYVAKKSKSIDKKLAGHPIKGYDDFEHSRDERYLRKAKDRLKNESAIDKFKSIARKSWDFAKKEAGNMKSDLKDIALGGKTSVHYWNKKNKKEGK